MHAVLPVYVFGIGIMCLLGAVRYCTLNPGPMYRGYRIGCNNTSVQPLERPGSRSSRPGSDSLASLVYAVRICKTLAAFLRNCSSPRRNNIGARSSLRAVSAAWHSTCLICSYGMHSFLGEIEVGMVAFCP